MSDEGTALLERALQVSRELLAAADRGDGQIVTSLDAERRQLLESVRQASRPQNPRTRSLLQEITLLNDQSIGLLEHHRRIKERQLDVAAAGRRAVQAYSTPTRRR